MRSPGVARSISKRQWMEQKVENELLKFNNFYPHTTARFPPSVWVETRVACRLDGDTNRITPHGTIKHPPDSSRMVLGGHEHNRSNFMFDKPRWQYLTFAAGSGIRSADPYDIFNTKRLQLTNLPCALILIGESPANEFLIFSARRIRKDGNALCDPAVDEVCRFDRSSATGIERYNDDVGGDRRFIGDKRPSCCAQHRLPKGANGEDRSRG